MRKLLQLISIVALIATLVPAVMFMNGSIDLDMVKTLMTIATFVWFIVTPFWMGREQKS